MENKTTKIIIEVKDGLVQSVYSNNAEVDIVINDLDSIPEEDCASTEGLNQIY